MPSIYNNHVQADVDNAKAGVDYWDKVRGEVIRQRSGEAETAESLPAEPKPVGRGVFGDIYDQFKGKAKEAVKFLMGKKSGEAVDVLRHKDVDGGISLVWGDEKAGLAHIVEKHPELVENLQEALDGMSVSSQSDNRIVLESDTHKAVISKMKGSEPTENWLLTAYEKKKPVSASSSDIETEPEGKRNGTAAPQNELSDGKGSDVSANKQANAEKNDGTTAGLVANEHTGKLAKSAQTMLDEVAKQTGLSVRPSNSDTIATEMWSKLKAMASPDARQLQALDAAKSIWQDMYNAEVARVKGSDTAQNSEKLPAEPQPVGRGVFGDIYDQFKGKAKEALNFLISRKSGDLTGVFHRDEIGDIDLVWGDKNGGLEHILDKHVGDGKSFASTEDVIDAIDDIIKNGAIGYNTTDKVVFRNGSKLVTIRKNVRDKGKKIADKNWVLTAYDEEAADGNTSAIASTNQVQAAPDTANPDAKVVKVKETAKASGRKVAESSEGGEKVLGFDRAEVAKDAEKADDQAKHFEQLDQIEEKLAGTRIEELMSELDNETTKFKSVDFATAKKLGLWSSYRRKCYDIGHEIGAIIGDKDKVKTWFDNEIKNSGISVIGTMPILDGLFDGAKGIDENRARYNGGLDKDTQGANDRPVSEDEPQPVGRGVFGDIYDQFKGKAKEAFNFLISRKSGDLTGVFHRDEIGDIDLVWGDKNGGLEHILEKHINDKDFKTQEEMIGVIDDTINNGEIVKSDQYHHEIVKDGYIVSLRKDYDGVKKNWVVTSFKLQNPNSKQPISDTTLSSPNINQGGRTVTANSADSASKGKENIPDVQGDDAENSMPERMEGEKVLGFDRAEVANEAEKAVKKVGIYDSVLKDKKDPRTALKGVFHDNGYLVGSDSRVIVSMKGEYPDNLEGKITDKKGAIVDTEMKFPKWERVLPKFDENQLVPESVDNIIEAAIYAKKLNETLGEDVVAVVLSNGKMFMSSNLLKPAAMAKKLGYHIITTSPDKDRPLIFRKTRNGKEFVGSMPTNYYGEKLHINSNDMTLQGGVWNEVRRPKLPENEQEKAMFDNVLNQLLKSWGKDKFSNAYNLSRNWDKYPPKYKDFFHSELLEEVASKGKPEAMQYIKSLMEQNVQLGGAANEVANKPSARTRKMVEAGKAQEDNRYSVLDEEAAMEADRAEETTMRMDNLKVAKEMEKVGDKDVIKNVVAHLFNLVKNGRLTGRSVAIGQMTEEGKNAIQQKFEISLNPHKVLFNLNPSDMKHIIDNHYGDNESDIRNEPLTDEDILNMVDVIYRPDFVVNLSPNGGLQKFAFLKDSEDGALNMVEVLADKNGVFTTKTYFRTKKKAGQRANDIIQSLLPTSIKRSDLLLSCANLKNLFESTKPFSHKIIKLATGWERGKDGEWQYDEGHIGNDGANSSGTRFSVADEDKSGVEHLIPGERAALDAIGRIHDTLQGRFETTHIISSTSMSKSMLMSHAGL